MDREQHWDRAYRSKAAEDVSWYQASPALSLELIERAAEDRGVALIDVGGGASRLIDCLLELGYADLSVLDVSAIALDVAQRRLGPRSSEVTWIHADVTAFKPKRRFQVWHDRAAFHFLVEPADRAAYREALHAGLAPGGQLIIAAFALDGPARCSGLDVVRYDGAGLAAELGGDFVLLEQRSETHNTPAGKPQRFGYWRFQRKT